jgi:hypothetical protein
LGQLQRSEVDTIATGTAMTVARLKDFQYTTAFNIERYGALMKRQKDTFAIDFDGITAGIALRTYGIMLAVSLLLFIVAWLNEHFQQTNKRNSTWRILLAIILPCNGELFKYQSGVTRKLLVATSGFGILILSSLYQAKYSEYLMVPYPPPMATLTDIENLVSSGRAKLMFDDENSVVTKYVLNVSTVLANSIETNPPIYEWDIRLLHEENAIALSTESVVLSMLYNGEPQSCKNYVFITFDEWTRIYTALIMRKGHKMLESMNFIVAERMPFVDDYIQSFQLKEECRKHIFPDSASEPQYQPLKLMEFSAPLVFLFLFLCLAVVILFIEIVLFRRNGKKGDQETEQSNEDKFTIYFCRNDGIEVSQTVTFEKYTKFRDLLEPDLE